MAYGSTMLKVNVADAKTHLSRYLDLVERGETVVVCRRNVPIAEFRPVAKLHTEPRPVGIDRGMEVPPVSSSRFRTACSTPSKEAMGRSEAPARYVHVPVTGPR